MQPDGAVIVFTALRRLAAQFNPALFTITMRKRKRVQAQLRAMSQGDLDLIWQAFTPDQRKIVRRLGRNSDVKPDDLEIDE